MGQVWVAFKPGRVRWDTFGNMPNNFDKLPNLDRFPTHYSQGAKLSKCPRPAEASHISELVISCCFFLFFFLLIVSAGMVSEWVTKLLFIQVKIHLQYSNIDFIIYHTLH